MFKKKILPTIVFILLLFGMLLFPYIPMELFNLPYESFSLDMRIIYILLCDIGYMSILFLIYKDKIIKDFNEYRKGFWKNFEKSFKYYFIGLVIMIISNLIITLFITEAVAGNEEGVRDMIDTAPLYMIFSVSIYAPFVEELIFRHSIKDAIMCYGNNKLTRGIYIFISGFIFAAMHIIGQTTSVIDYVYIIPYMSLGIAFSALYNNTDNIFSSISMHCLHNTFTVILYFVTGGVI